VLLYLWAENLERVMGFSGNSESGIWRRRFQPIAWIAYISYLITNEIQLNKLENDKGIGEWVGMIYKKYRYVSS